MAGFNTAVTGLKSASTLLDVAGNNIANSSTVGFKSSRTEFGDIYATAVVGAGSSNTAGSGVTVSDIAQDFSGGTIEFTNSNLDLAINGSGFFQLNDGRGGISYTRAGSFELDKDGFIVSKGGKFLQGFGLDALGNQLPIQNLAVDQKESPPKATERVGLSFNINANADATTLEPVFSKTDPNSYTYSTTVGTFDSLGNENNVRFYFAEQRPAREVYRYDVSGGATTVSGLVLGAPGATVAGELQLQSAVNNRAYLTADGAALLADTDPRIDPASFYLDTSTNKIHFEFFSEFTQYGDVAVTVGGVTALNELTGALTERDANEVHYFDLANAAFDDTGTAALDDELQGPFTLTIGGVEIELQAGISRRDVGETIESFAQQIIDNNPDVESVEYNSTANRIMITYKATSGNIQDGVAVSVDPVPDGVTTISPISNTDTSTGVAALTVQYEGDNSYIASYRMYAFLNDSQQLNIGKAQDPGRGTQSEVGPIMVTFNPTTGVLESVNGSAIPTGGNAPKITILGADPANPNDDLLASDVDSLRGIQLDITGSSQFASQSIVKSQSQDGYAKGDLIGVTFASTGEMVASFSNGQRQNLGLVAIATFENQSGLQPSGDTEWIATLVSGNAILNPPGTGLNGSLRSAALEQSNVDLSGELVKLIEGQRNFQANSKTLETLNTVTQAILQI